MPKRKVLAAVIAVLVALVSASCTHNPITNEKAFNNFGECMVANVGGTTALILIQRRLEDILNQKMGNKSDVLLPNTGTQAGKNMRSVLIAMGATLTAWRECAAVYQKVEYSEEVSRDEVLKSDVPNVPKTGPAVKITELSVKATRPGEPVLTRVRYIVLGQDPARKDIPVVERRSFEIGEAATPAMKAASMGTSIAATGPTASNGNTSFHTMMEVPHQIVANQGSRRADGEIPTPQEMPANQLYRFGFSVEAEGLKDVQQVEFRFDGKEYSAPIAPARNQNDRMVKTQASSAPVNASRNPGRAKTRNKQN